MYAYKPHFQKKAINTCDDEQFKHHCFEFRKPIGYLFEINSHALNQSLLIGWYLELGNPSTLLGNTLEPRNRVTQNSLGFIYKCICT